MKNSDEIIQINNSLGYNHRSKPSEQEPVHDPLAPTSKKETCLQNY